MDNNYYDSNKTRQRKTYNKRKKRLNIKKFFMGFVASVLTITVILSGLFAAVLYAGRGSILKGISVVFGGTPEEPANVLLIGLDKSTMHGDVIMVVQLDPVDNEINILSIPRDTRVEVSPGRYDKINHTMGYSNPEKSIINAVEGVTGIPIDFYCEITFEGFRKFIDELGGVEFDVPVPMHYEDPDQDLYIHIDKGLQVLNGQQAEGVVRFRNTYARADLQRIEVQQDFLKALFEQKLNGGIVKKVPEILEVMYEEVETDFPLDLAMRYSGMLESLNGESLSAFTLPCKDASISGVSYVAPIEEEVRQLVLTEFGYPKDKAKDLKKENEAGGPIDELE